MPYDQRGSVPYGVATLVNKALESYFSGNPEHTHVFPVGHGWQLYCSHDSARTSTNTRIC